MGKFPNENVEARKLRIPGFALRAFARRGSFLVTTCACFSKFNKLMLLLPHHQHRVRRQANHLLGRAAKDYTCYSGMALGRKDDQVGTKLPGGSHDLGGGRARTHSRT